MVNQNNKLITIAMIITLLVAQWQYASCAFAENEKDNTTAINQLDGRKRSLYK